MQKSLLHEILSSFVMNPKVGLPGIVQDMTSMSQAA
jgi:hypothetical protein